MSKSRTIEADAKSAAPRIAVPHLATSTAAAAPPGQAKSAAAHGTADPTQLGARLLRLMERGQRVMVDALQRRQESDNFNIPDQRVVAATFEALGQRLLADPGKLIDAQAELWRSNMQLWLTAFRRAAEPDLPPVAAPAKDDKRFLDKAWSENPLFDFIKQAYLVNARWLQSTVRSVDGLDKDTQRKAEFYTRQFVNALAPSNFPFTNPKVLDAIIESGGENLVNGLAHMVEDLERGHGKLDIKMTDFDAFRLGENVAASPGKVVYQNDLMQLIQYAPATADVHRRPLLIIPPWINKFYILDLKPQNSFIKWAVEQGHTVFVVSWVNPDQALAQKTFADYMDEGPFAALDAVEQATGEREANVIGYCIGGTLLACTLAYMAEKGDHRFASATFFTAMTDFAESGELKVFIDEEQLRLLEDHLAHKGYLEAHQMANVFNMMRDNDLIWSFVVNNYLLGKEPLPFDLLYWNSDATRMPAAMHTFYMRNMYMENRLIQRGGIILKGVPLDLRKITLPVYQLSTETDHIAPWKSTYTPSQLYRGTYRFVLSGSGHIAGVVNPPAAKKYCYWSNEANPPTPDEWFASATRHDGSWWPDWTSWIAKHGGGMVPARAPGDGKLTPIEDAPGSYVKVKATD
jgi:polyhydroxyalkanoate synthase